MASLQTRSLLFILIISLTNCGSRAIVPACFSQGADSGRVICEDEDLTWVTAQDMTSAFQGTTGVSEIILRRCDVLPDLVFFTSTATSSLKSLTLDGMSLRRPLTIDPFVQFIGSLELLNFSNMIDLDTVQFMKIAAIRRSWESLHTFTVRNCSLLSLDPDLWRFLPRIEKLNFSHNNLYLFDFKTIGRTNLVELDASYNRISVLRNLQWDSLPSLKKFIMTSNKLTDAEILSKLPDTVVELRLNGNSFSEITLNRAAESDLQTLILSNNSLKTMRPSFHDSNRRSLETLELDGNRGLNISGLFGGLTKLKLLSLKSCYITTVEKQFQNLSSLETLNLAENLIENVPQSTFIGSTKLKCLNLRSNHLRRLDFLEAVGETDMTVLDSLDLTDNNLSNLPSFIKAPNIRLLSIRKNRLDKLSGCNYTEALIKLESFCAPALKPDSSCEYLSFIETIQLTASRLKAFNDERCCGDPVPTNPACCIKSGTTCYSHINKIELPRSCPTLDTLCTQNLSTPTKAVIVEGVVTQAPRKLFENLEHVEWFVAILGYFLALVLLVLFICLVCSKASTDKRRRQLRFEQDVNNELRFNQSAHHVSTNNQPAPIAHKFRARRLDSGRSQGSCSLESNFNYSEGEESKDAVPNLKPESTNVFRSGQKCHDTKASPTRLNSCANKAPKNVYTAQVQQQEIASCSSSESPDSMLLYSYATKPGINPAQHDDHQLSLSELRRKSASDILDGPPIVPNSLRPLLPSNSIRPVIGAKQQSHRTREKNKRPRSGQRLALARSIGIPARQSEGQTISLRRRRDSLLVRGEKNYGLEEDAKTGY